MHGVTIFDGTIAALGGMNILLSMWSTLLPPPPPPPFLLFRRKRRVVSQTLCCYPKDRSNTFSILYLAWVHFIPKHIRNGSICNQINTYKFLDTPASAASSSPPRRSSTRTDPTCTEWMTMSRIYWKLRLSPRLASCRRWRSFPRRCHTPRRLLQMWRGPEMRQEVYQAKERRRNVIWSFYKRVKILSTRWWSTHTHTHTRMTPLLYWLTQSLKQILS